MSRLVLDAWAVLAWLQDEGPAARSVGALLADASSGSRTLHLSWINLGEVYYAIQRRAGRMQADEFLRRFGSAPVSLEGATDARVLAAARLKGTYALSYADAFAASLAQELDATLVTGDAEFRALEKTEALALMWLER